MKILYILLAIVILLVLIMVHELGHYTAGKILKFKINEFSIGFGKAIFQKTNKSGEKFSIRLFPLGGFCAFDGEDEEGESEHSFNKQKPWKRLIVLFSGVLFNFIFGVLMSVVYLSMASYARPQVLDVQAGNSNLFKKDDIIIAVNGNKLDYYKVSKDTMAQFSDLVSKFDVGEEFTVTVIRNGNKQDVSVKKEYRTPYRYITKADALITKGYIQVYNELELKEEYIAFTTEQQAYDYLFNLENSLDSIYYKNSDGEYVAYEKEQILSLCGITEADGKAASLGILQTYNYTRYNFGQALLYAIPFSLDVCWLILCVLGGLFTGKTAVAELGGTITAIDQIAEITSYGIKNIVYLIPLISMNLAVFNLLPIPALDGARMVFVIIEWIRRKPINKNVEGYIHFFGLIALLALVLFLDFYHFFIL